MREKASLVARIVLSTVIVLGLLNIASPPALSQVGQGNNLLPTPTVEVDFRAGEAGQEPEDGVKASIIATIPFEERCACGARFEAKLKNSEEWVVLGLFAPEETGDEVEQHSWTLVSNLFQRSMEYDIRVSIFDRLGGESAYGSSPATLTPYQEPNCVEGTFSDLQREAEGEGDEALLFFDWTKVCSQNQEANRYKIFKNGQYLRDTDEGANSIVLAGEPTGSTWKIEAYGDEPPNTNPAIIRDCNEVVPKLNARLNARPTIIPAVRVARLLQCQPVGGLLRTIIEWEPYTHCAVNCNYVSPDFWVTWSAFTPPPNQGHWQPLLNYPTPSSPASFWWPGPPGPGSWELLKMGWRCRKVGTTVDNGNNGFNSDPMNQVGWTCPGTWTNGELGPNTVYRQWLNFDLANLPTNNLWPIATEFTY